MPPKKKPSPNGFFHFMQSLRPQLKREGVVVGSNRELAELAGPRWAVSFSFLIVTSCIEIYILRFKC